MGDVDDQPLGELCAAQEPERIRHRLGVVVGTVGAPAQDFGRINPADGTETAYTTLTATPVSREKPYLYIDGSGNLQRNTALFNDPSAPGRTLAEAQLASLPQGQDLLDFHDEVRSALDVLTIPLPGRTMNAQEIWQAQRQLAIETLNID